MTVSSEPRTADTAIKPLMRSLTVRSGVILTLALFLANASNYLFQVLSGRFLGPDEYGLLSSIFTMVVIVGVATSSLQAAFAKAEAARRGEHLSGRKSFAAAVGDPLLRVVFVAATGVGLILVALSPFLGHFFHSAAAPIAMFGLLVPSIAMLSVSLGRLQGLGRYLPLAVLSVSIAVAKLGLGSAVLVSGLGVTSVVAVITLVTACAALCGLYLTSDSARLSDNAIFSDIARALIALAIFRIIAGIDVPLARHWLPADVAGEYAAASVIGKGVLWLPDIVALVVFPQLAAAISQGQSAVGLLRRATALALSVCLVSTFALWLGAELIFTHLFGGGYDGSADLSWKLALVSTPLALANLFVLYHVAGRGWRWLISLFLVFAIQMVMFSMLHDTSEELIAATGIGAVLVAVTLGYPALRPRRAVAAGTPA